MNRYLRLAAVIFTAAAMAACSHTVYIHEPPGGGFQLERPRYPLKASIALEGSTENNEAVYGLLERSGYFSSLQKVGAKAPGGQFDLDIAYRGVQCGTGESASDSFLSTWFTTAKFVVVTVPTLGVVPPGANRDTPCEHIFAYRFRSPAAAQARSVSYPFRVVEYTTTAPQLYAAGDKRKHQKEFLMDQSVAALLNDIAGQLRNR